MVNRKIVGSCGGCHHFVPCLLAGLLARSRDQPKLCHCNSAAAATEVWEKCVVMQLFIDDTTWINKLLPNVV